MHWLVSLISWYHVPSTQSCFFKIIWILTPDIPKTGQTEDSRFKHAHTHIVEKHRVFLTILYICWWSFDQRERFCHCECRSTDSARCILDRSDRPGPNLQHKWMLWACRITRNSVSTLLYKDTGYLGGRNSRRCSVPHTPVLGQDSSRC